MSYYFRGIRIFLCYSITTTIVFSMSNDTYNVMTIRSDLLPRFHKVNKKTWHY